MIKSDSTTRVSFTGNTSKIEYSFRHAAEKGTIELNCEERSLAHYNSKDWVLENRVHAVLTHDQALYLAERIVEAINNCKKEEALCADCE